MSSNLERLERENALLKRQVARLERENESLRKKSTRDHLTGLLNRGAFTEVARQSLSGLKRRENSCASLIFLDLDHFKAINDNYGHEAGDNVLVEVARVLRDALRDGDAIGRIGGEEISILFPDMAEADAFRKAENIRERIANRRFTAGPLKLAVTASIGVSSIDPGSEAFRDMKPGEMLDELLRLADSALYGAKKNGRNQVNCSKEPSQGSSKVVLSESRLLRRAGR